MQAECENEADGRRGQVVVYVTSVQAVRSTYEECRRVVQILRNMHVAFQQKDVFLHPDYRKELMERLRVDKPTVPQVSTNTAVCINIVTAVCAVLLLNILCYPIVFLRYS